MDEIFKKKYWSVVFIFYVILFNVPFCTLAVNFTNADIALAWVVNVLVACSFSVVALYLRPRARKCLISIIFLLSLIPNLIVLSYLVIAHVHIHNDIFWVIFESSPSESSEYVEQFISRTVKICLSTYVLGAVLLLLLAFRNESSSQLPFKKKKIILVASLLLLILIQPFQDVCKVMSSFDFYQSGARYLWEGVRMRYEIGVHKEHKMEVDCTLDKRTPHTFVVVLGESLSSGHMHLYGYGRQTTPALDSMRNDFYVYKDVVSPSTHTIAVLNRVLTFADYNHPEYYFQRPSIIDLYADAGFTTHWISNQEFVNKLSGCYSLIAQQADSVYALSPQKKPDGLVLSYLDTILDSKQTGNRIIFIHLMGNHYAYKYRYPKEFSYFDHKKDSAILDKPFLDEGKKTIIDEYDNSIRYTDFVVSSVINRMKCQGGSSFVLFFSDHGEEVYDYRNFCGHDILKASSYQCEVPFILWCSEEYKKEMPSLEFDESRPFGTEHVIHSLSSLCGLKYKDYDPQFSLFDSRFAPQKRMVGNVTYEELVEKTKKEK